MAHFERRSELGGPLRGAYARALRCDPADVALTTCTSEGIGQVVMRPGARARAMRSSPATRSTPGCSARSARRATSTGRAIREVPLAGSPRRSARRPPRRVLARELGDRALAPAELAEVDVPVLLDGAQGIGAVDVDVARARLRRLRGRGAEVVLRARRHRGRCGSRPSCASASPSPAAATATSPRPNDGLDAPLHDGRAALRRALAERRGARLLAGRGRAARASSAGPPSGSARARSPRGSPRCSPSAAASVPRGESTLVSFPSEDPEAERGRLAERGVVVRNIPGRPWLRASVGAWNDEGDLERLLGALARERDRAARRRSQPRRRRRRARQATRRCGPAPRRRARAARRLGVVVALGGAEHRPPLPERLREHLLLGWRQARCCDSWHNFFFVSFDPGGLVTVDKPPLALWVQAASAKLFGFSPLSLLLPRRCWACRGRRCSTYRRQALRDAAALRGRARARACSPPSSRSRATTASTAADPADACWPAARRSAPAKPGAGARCCGAACSSGWPSTPRRSPPIWSCRASRSPTACARPARCGGASLQLLARRRGDGAWSRSPGSRRSKRRRPRKRPYVGSSTNNTELGLTFEYNGFGRVEGQTGGPGQTRQAAARACRITRRQRIDASSTANKRAEAAAAGDFRRPAEHGREREPDPVRWLARPAAAVRQRPAATRPAGSCRSPSSA